MKDLLALIEELKNELPNSPEVDQALAVLEDAASSEAPAEEPAPPASSEDEFDFNAPPPPAK